MDKDLDARQEFVGEAGENESERDGPRELTNKVKLQVITTKYLSQFINLPLNSKGLGYCGAGKKTLRSSFSGAYPCLSVIRNGIGL